MFDSPLLRKYLAYNLRILSSDRPVHSLIVRVRASWRIILSASSNWLRSPA
jgi:hypothetical protein